MIQAFTDIGVRYSSNQDSYWVATLEVDSKPAHILLLCDGMGGLEGGEYASQVLVSTVREAVIDGSMTQEGILEALNLANDRLVDESKEKGTQWGTTASFLYLSEGTFWGYHIGDSRLYQFRGVNFRTLTEDHTHLNHLRKRGETITPEMESKYASTLSRALGIKKRPKIDFIEGEYEPHDTFVACSDGFWHYWDMTLDDLENSIEEAKNRGEKDNITVIAVRVPEVTDES